MKDKSWGDIKVTDWPVVRYPTVVIDPPWSYGQTLVGDTMRGSTRKHYPTMEVEEIKALDVPGILEKDAQLWLWTTNTHLHEAFHCFEAWGIKYRTVLTWAKNRFGLGYWLRGQTEHVLLGTVGNPRSKFVGPNGATGMSYSTLILTEDVTAFLAPVARHSAKPQGFIDMVEAMGEGPYLEVFCRDRRLGWNGWPEAAVEGETFS